MQIVARYSHLNGEEYLKVHSPNLLEELNRVKCTSSDVPVKVSYR